MRQLLLVSSLCCIAACGVSRGPLDREGFSPPGSGASAGGSGSGNSAGARPDEAQGQPTGSLPVYDGGYWLQLSADDSTSMASAQLARLGTTTGLHRHEFLNYYDPAASLFDDEPWAVEEQLDPAIKLGASLVLSTDADGGTQAELLLQLRAKPVDPETRRAWHLVYCVDVSGSMAGDKIVFTRDALNRSLAHLRSGDRVSIVAFSNEAETRVSYAQWPQDEGAIRTAITGLEPTGGTNMIAGLNAAYDLAGQHLSAGTLSRVLLFGDGQANVGDTDVQRFASLTRNGNDEGIYLSSIGVGSDFDWNRMDTLADSGKGASIFLPDAREVTRMFGSDFYKLVEVSADAVEVELVLNDGFVLADFSGEETSTNPNQRVPSTILSSGDDLTMLARFHVTQQALDSPLSMRVSFKPLGSGQGVVTDRHFEFARDLVVTGGPLHARTRLVDDYARWVTTGALGKDVVKSALSAHPVSDPGLAEILQLLQ